jgi:hypothetical protein
MTTGAMSPGLRKRLLSASILACAALVLTAAGMIRGGTHRTVDPAARRAAESGIAAALDSLFPAFGIDAGTVRSWKATAAGGPTGRIEARIKVPPGFRSLEFNHALARRIAPFGAGVVATERSKENTVTMHIVRDGMTIRSLSFVPEPAR